jgi:signal transduction histidine kinase
MFELERWTVRLAAGGFAALALFAADAVLAGLLRLDQPVALALALVIVGYVWMPLRARLWQSIVGGRLQSPEELLRQAAQVAFLDDHGERRRAWHRLLDRVFEPAEIAPLPQAPASPMLAQDGVALLLPALAGEGPLRLSHARRGAGLFGQAALGTARELASLIAAAEQARAAYVRGVHEERRRIARDLHDDVSALLLTALHRPGLDDARSDVNRALAEVRVMASSLAGRSQTLDVVLGDSRYEAASRLAAAGIELDWPAASDLPGADCLLGYACHKALTSALRETLTNVIRHSGARMVAVRAALAGGTLRITVRDDGHGLAVQRASGQSVGNGLPNLAQRLREFGGECILETRPGGLTVRLVLPIDGVRTPL